MLYRILTMLIFVSTLTVASSEDNQKATGEKQKQITSGKEQKVDEKFEQVDEYPTVIKQIQPKYPETARKNRQEGIVYIGALITTTGKVKEAKVTKNETKSVELGNAALEAVKQWEFKPATLKNKAVEIMVTIPVRFKLAEGKEKKK
jgi:periplasmic protein TonB